jgi:hypothetical protein
MKAESAQKTSAHGVFWDEKIVTPISSPKKQVSACF